MNTLTDEQLKEIFLEHYSPRIASRQLNQLNGKFTSPHTREMFETWKEAYLCLLNKQESADFPKI